MRIGVWMYGYLPKIGGAQISAHCLADAFVALGHPATVYAADYLLRECSERGWRFRYETRGVGLLPFRLSRWLGRPGNWAAARLLARVVRQDRLDVVQIVGAWPWLPLVLDLREAARVPVLLRSAGDDIQVDHALGYGVRRDSRVGTALRSGIRGLDAAVAISQTVADEYGALGVPPSSVRIIPPGVDLDAFRSCDTDPGDVRARWGLPAGRRLIISVGRNHQKKGFDQLVKALAVLNRGGDRFALAIVGAGVDGLTPVAESEGVADAFYPIHEVAGQPEPQNGTFPSRGLIELYRAADYFVLPSYLETYANVALEAMAAGVPVVVTDAPGCRETVEDGVDGLKVPAGSPDAIAAAVLRLESDEGLRRSLVAGGLEKARSQDWRTIAGRYLELYESLCG